MRRAIVCRAPWCPPSNVWILMLMHVLIFTVWQGFVHQTSWLFSCFFSQKPPETLGLARCFRDVSSMPLQRSVTSMARIPRTDAAVGHCPFCTERFARWPHLTWDCDGTPQNEIQRPVRFHHYLSWRFSWAVKSQSETGRIAVLHWLMCARKSFDGNECRLTRPWWMLHAQQGLAAPSYTACLVCLYRCFHAASPGILWNWLSRTCEEHVQGLLEQANWC